LRRSTGICSQRIPHVRLKVRLRIPQDGLFRVTASFSPGFGTELGKGYVLQLDLVTLEKVPQAEVERMQREAVGLIQDGLESVLPGRGLTVQRDGNVWKIVGDLSITSLRTEH
jgi:hypothetical protein